MKDVTVKITESWWQKWREDEFEYPGVQINRTDIFAFEKLKKLLMSRDFEDIFPNKSLGCSDFKGKLNIELSALRAIHAGDREIKAECLG